MKSVISAVRFVRAPSSHPSARQCADPIELGLLRAGHANARTSSVVLLTVTSR